jgi:hypothetical protein
MSCNVCFNNNCKCKPRVKNEHRVSEMRRDRTRSSQRDTMALRMLETKQENKNIKRPDKQDQ